MNILKAANLGLAFLLELYMLFAYGYWAYKLHTNWIVKVATGMVVLAIVATLWAFFAAPNATMRLNQPWLFIFQLIVFSAASALFFFSGQRLVSILLLLIWFVSTSLSIIWKQ